MLRDSTHHFRALLAESRTLLDTFPEHAAASSVTWLSPAEAATAWHWQTYAWAVQVFAAMTAEAALNTYGMVRFGPDEFERHFRWNNPVVRLKRMAQYGAGVRLKNKYPLVRTLASLMAKRDGIVHMQSNQDLPDKTGRMVSSSGPPPDWLAGADAAIQEMEAFLVGLRQLDPDPRMSVYWMALPPLG